MSTLDFDHKRDRRSLHHRYAEAESEIRGMAEAALRNEFITRQRVETLEATFRRSFMDRLRWLFLGR